MIHWWDNYDNMVTLTAWLADNAYDAKDVAYAVEKPWKYEGEFYAAKYDLDEGDLIEIMEAYDDMDEERSIEELAKAKAAQKADAESDASQHLFDQFKAGSEEGRPS